MAQSLTTNVFECIRVTVCQNTLVAYHTEGIPAMLDATVTTISPRARPADTTIHILCRAHRSAFGEFRAAPAGHAAWAEAEALVSCLAVLPARTSEGKADKVEVLRSILILFYAGEVADMMENGDDNERALLCSVVLDAMALS